MKSKICYLCGKPGADTRDHVPPKAFLQPGNYEGSSRITLPAHKECNHEFSADEDYVRDILGPAAEHLGLHGLDTVLEKIDKSLKRPNGLKRRKKFLKQARPIELKSPAGLYTGQALGIPFNRDRVHRVGIKIARGIIYHDARAVVPQEKVICFGIPLQEVQKEREKELKKGNPFWVTLSWNTCLYELFADSVAVRRVYLGHPTTPDITIECTMGVILLATFFVVGTSFPLPKSAPPDFRFHIDTSSGAWIHTDGASNGGSPPGA